MPTIIDALVVTLGLDNRNFKAGQKQTADDLKKTKDEANRQAAEIAAAGKRAADFFKTVRNEAIALFAVFTAGRGIKEFAQDVTRSDAATGRLAYQLGLSTETLTAWQGAAERAGGTAAATGGTLNGLAQQFEQFKLTGESSVIPYFRALGVAISDTAGHARPLNDVLLDLADKFHGMTPARAQAFGAGIGLDQGTIQLLERGRGAVQALLDQQQRLGVVSERDSAAAVKLTNALLDAQQVVTSLGRTILTDVTPTITALLREFDNWLEKNREFIASGINDALQQFGAWIKGIDWVAVRQGASDFLTGVSDVVKALGGWKTATETLFALWAGSKALSMIATLTTISGLLGTTATGLAALFGLGAASTAAIFANPGSAATHEGNGASGLTPSNESDAASANGGGGKLGGLVGGAWNWTKSQTAGILANLQRESGLDPNLTGDNGAAYGIGQWHADRQAAFKAWAGHDIHGSSLGEQLGFVNFELTQGAERRAGSILSGIRDNAAAAGAAVSRFYERPADADGEAAARAALASRISAGYSPDAAGGSGGAPVTIGTIVIHTQATDAKGIADSIGPALQSRGVVTQSNVGVN